MWQSKTDRRGGTARTEPRNGSAGFVLTLEFLLVMVVFVLPLMIGAIALGRKVVTLYLNQRSFLEQPYAQAVVFDGADPPRVVGPVIGYDEYEAPLVIFRDGATGAGAVLGVRRDRFTSYGQVFYTDSDCTQAPRIRAWDANVATGKILGVFVGHDLGYPPVGFTYQLQQRSYAMGNANVLYQSGTPGGSDITSAALPVVGGLGADVLDGPLYVWKSQDTTPADPLAPVLDASPPCFLVPIGTTIENLVAAEAVIDFDDADNYLGPYQVGFPTTPDDAGGGVAGPLPWGEVPR